ncbi:AtpZ/AtpI family protein [Hydrogenovibrio kuenenii]|uniref:AtpZ/AtpI family protein n=1 Tax=Hydrogenovibrio kuenenii TaxID=63658 RepID=UPI0004650427|nr:AtpZ/AtpI family protein [Hydrogenovibrio kuenenii]
MKIPEKRVEESSSSKKKPALNFLLMSAGSVFTSMIVAGFLVGYFFDQLFNTTPLFLLSCGVLGFIGGILKIHKLLSKMDLLELPAKDKEAGATDTEDQDKNAK